MLPLSPDKLNEFSRTAVHGSQWQSLNSLKMLELNREGLWPYAFVPEENALDYTKR